MSEPQHIIEDPEDYVPPNWKYTALFFGLFAVIAIAVFYFWPDSPK